MKAILLVVGIAMLVVAAVYFLLPADSLPAFFPGHEAGLARIRVKHGLLSGGLGIVCLAGAWIMGRR